MDLDQIGIRVQIGDVNGAIHSSVIAGRDLVAASHQTGEFGTVTARRGQAASSLREGEHQR